MGQGWVRAGSGLGQGWVGAGAGLGQGGSRAGAGPGLGQDTSRDGETEGIKPETQEAETEADDLETDGVVTIKPRTKSAIEWG